MIAAQATPISPRPRIVALNGSERPGGNTAQVLRHVVEVGSRSGADVEVIDLRSYVISDCAPCGDCNTRTVPCIVNDGVAEIVERMLAADGIIYACPVHGYGMSSIMQRFIERAGVGYLRFDRPLANKVGGVVVTGRRYAHTDVYAQLMHNVMLNRMILVGSGYPAVVHGGRPGEALEDDEGMSSVTAMVLRMIDLLALLQRHRELTGQSIRTETANERQLLPSVGTRP